MPGISGETRAEPTRLQILLWGATMVLTLYLLFYDWSGYQVGTYGDDGSYVAVTDSLLRDVNYGMLLDPGETEPTQFPFVYPMLLAPLRAWFPHDLNALRIVSLVATLALLTVLFWSWRWLGGGLSYWWGLAVTAVMALSPVTILHGRTVMSEAVFLLFVLLLVFWVEFVIARSPRGWGILLGVLAFGTVYTRTVGWVLLVPAVGYLIWKMRGTLRWQLGVAAATIAVLLGMTLMTTSVRPMDLLPQEYMAQLAGILDNRLRNTSIIAEVSEDAVSRRSYAQAVGESAIDIVNHFDIADKLPYQMENAVIDGTNQIGMPFLRYLPILGALVVVGLGVVLWVRRTGLTLLLLVAPLYILMLMFWAWNGSRLMYPVQPQIFLALLLGGYAIAAWVIKRFLGNNPRVLAVSLTTLLLLWLGMWVWLDVRLSQTMLLPGDQIARAARLRQYIPADAIVLSTRAETDFLYSPQRFIEVPRARITVDDLRDYLIDHRVDYVIMPVGLDAAEQVRKLRIGQQTRFVLNSEPLIRAHALVELYSNAPEDMAIFRIDKDVLGTLEGE